MSGELLRHFACPVCGRVRALSSSTLRSIARGATTGECPTGSGCRTAVDQVERYRRFWLLWAGVDDVTIRGCGGARAFVLEFGLPERLWPLADVMPSDGELVVRPGARRLARGPRVPVDAAA